MSLPTVLFVSESVTRAQVVRRRAAEVREAVSRALSDVEMRPRAGEAARYDFRSRFRSWLFGVCAASAPREVQYV